MSIPRVYIIGGFGSITYYYLILKKRLEHLGISCKIFNPGHFGLNIWPLCQFEERAKNLFESSEQISLIGHSLGGIQAMWLAFNYPNNINKIFAVSSPIWGSPIRVYENVILRLLDVPKDQWKDFQQKIDVIAGKIITLSSSEDLIAPPESCIIRGAKNYQMNIQMSYFSPSPHILIPFLNSLAECIAQELR